MGVLFGSAYLYLFEVISFFLCVYFVSLSRFYVLTLCLSVFAGVFVCEETLIPLLSLSLRYGIFERCRELVEAGFDVRQPDKENVTLLHWAAINNRIDLVK